MVVAVVLLAGVGLVAAVAQRPRSDEPEEILVDAHPESVEGTRMWAQLPTGRLSVTVGEPVTTIPEDEALYPEELIAPEGQMFLPIALNMTGDGVPLDLELATRNIQVRPELSMRVAGHEYRLGTTQDLGLPTYVQVEKADTEGSHLELIVEFDGVTQRVDGEGVRETREAAGLYGLPEGIRSQDCPRRWMRKPGSTRATVAMRCYVNAMTYPYLSGHGWAHQREPGHTWAIVSTATTFESATLRRPAAGPTDCEPYGPGEGSTELEGRRPTVVLNEFSATSVVGGVVSETLAFLVPERDRGDLEISRTYRCLSGYGLRTLELTKQMRVDLRS